MSTIPAGARWLIDSQPLVVREFGLSRLGGVQADQRTHYDGVLREKLQDVSASQLTYCDVKACMGEKKYQSVIADYEWIVGINDGSDDMLTRIHHIDIHHVV